MKIKHYLYNAFTVSEGKSKIAIDPGQNLWMFNKHSLIPESEWKEITHIFITHGDPDHFLYAVPMAKVSGASVVCGDRLKEDFNSQGIKNIFPLAVDETISLNEITITGLKVQHGPLPVKALGGLLSVTGQVKEASMGGQEIYLAGIRTQRIEKAMDVYSHGTVKLLFGLVRLEKDNLDFARGSIGFHIQINGKSIVNLGDSLIRDEWSDLKPDVLMIPIGGGRVPNTMDVKDAIEAVRNISPKLVIPCHYNVPYEFIRNVNPTDDHYFKTELEKLGIECRIMSNGEEIEY